MSNILSFSGGLDSTYLLNQLVKKRFISLSCVHYRFSSDKSFFHIPEVIRRRKIIRHYRKVKDGLFKEYFIYNKYCLKSKKLGSIMCQQAMLTTALSELLIEIQMLELTDSMTTVYLGWHKGDISDFTFDPHDLTHEEYKNLLTSIVTPANCVRLEHPIKFRAIMPNWELDKKFMYDALPDEVKKLIYFCNVRTKYDEKDGCFKLEEMDMFDEQYCSKEYEMLELGIKQYKDDLPYKVSTKDFSVGDALLHFGAISDIIESEFHAIGKEVDLHALKDLIKGQVTFINENIFYTYEDDSLYDILNKEENLKIIVKE